MSVSEARDHLNKFKAFALQNAHASRRLLSSTIELNSAFLEFENRIERKQTTIEQFFK